MFNQNVLKTGEMFNMFNLFNVLGKYKEAGGLIFPKTLNKLNILNISPVLATFY